MLNRDLVMKIGLKHLEYYYSQEYLIFSPIKALEKSDFNEIHKEIRIFLHELLTEF